MYDADLLLWGFRVKTEFTIFKSIYGNYLFKAGIPKEIASNFETLLQTYCNFMNGYAKHHDKTELNVLEYLMYQTGNIIRLLITLKQAEPAPEN